MTAGSSTGELRFLSRRELDALIANLTAFARSLGATSAADVAQEAMVRTLSGERRCVAIDGDWKAALMGVVRSLVSAERRLASRREMLGHAWSTTAVERSAEELFIDHEIRSRLERTLAECSADDDETRHLCSVILNGAVRRHEIAALLEWPPERVSAVRVRLGRRMRARLQAEPAPPPSSEVRLSVASTAWSEHGRESSEAARVGTNR